MKHATRCLVALLALWGCKGEIVEQGVWVTVDNRSGASEIVQLRALVANLDKSQPLLLPASPRSTPIEFPTDFSISVPTSRDGRVDIAIEALGSSGIPVASGSGHAILQGRTFVRASVDLGPVDVPAATGGAGGTQSAAGAVGSGGVIGSGGVAGPGGITGGGGFAGTGGRTATAGVLGSGGMVGTGGAIEAGGSFGLGGTIAHGGRTSATGGSGVGGGGTAAGGVEGTGGIIGVGGEARKGGSTGSAAMGGTTGGGGTDGGGTAVDVTIVPDPSWTCGMAEGIPPPSAGTWAFRVSLTISAIHDVGYTQFGRRRQLDVSGGTITGDRLNGSVMTGGLDYELTLSTGAMELEEILVFKTSDNVSIFVRNCGVGMGPSGIRIVPDVEAPTSGSYAWLNTAKLVGTRTVEGGQITLDIYDVSSASPTGVKIRLTDPAGVPNVSWDCVSASGTKGDQVFTENLTLGSSLSISNAKRGSRNIIPITGGTITGKVSGTILNGGADYQLGGSSGTALDARYTLLSSDGAFIIVRNCGPMTGLTPVFEAAIDGPYAFLTTGKFLSSSPGAGSGGVSVTFYERQ